ncbi:hypothetical protein EDB83DRAFT_117880 [Lactarius deliciosus]|nr:hypothetical protein EDB83DRAFT_117880 [Lactarius deliciosus]
MFKERTKKNTRRSERLRSKCAFGALIRVRRLFLCCCFFCHNSFLGHAVGEVGQQRPFHLLRHQSSPPPFPRFGVRSSHRANRSWYYTPGEGVFRKVLSPCRCRYILYQSLQQSLAMPVCRPVGAVKAGQIAGKVHKVDAQYPHWKVSCNESVCKAALAIIVDTRGRIQAKRSIIVRDRWPQSARIERLWSALCSGGGGRGDSLRERPDMCQVAAFHLRAARR